MEAKVYAGPEDLRMSKKAIREANLKAPENGCLLILTSGGYWGRGKDVKEAMKNLTSITGEWVVYVIEGDEKAGVNEMGGVWRHRQADSVAQDARGGE